VCHSVTQHFEFREIFVKTVCGEGDENVTESRSFHPNHNPTKVLGTAITENEFKAEYVDGAVVIKGTYEMNIWYAYNEGRDTALLAVPVEYEDKVPLRRNEATGDAVSEVRVWNTYGPKVTDSEVCGSDIVITCSRTWHAEIVGEAALCVKVYPGQCDVDSSDDKEYLTDDVEEEFGEDDELEIADEDTTTSPNQRS
jgi:spore coat protein E